ncbi:MAG TPA: 50S ribosomal protein L10, partial [Treponemataceae bacterium]|nr:50S ribosomal protein L10 [Treponemataceae bacterium]
MAIQAKKLQPAKTAAIADIKTRFETVTDYIFTEYRGLSVEQISALRDQLREKGCTYKVVKNNFARIAFEELNKGDVSSFFVGPTAVALPTEEANTAAKVLFD